LYEWPLFAPQIICPWTLTPMKCLTRSSHTRPRFLITVSSKEHPSIDARRAAGHSGSARLHYDPPPEHRASYCAFITRSHQARVTLGSKDFGGMGSHAIMIFGGVIFAKLIRYASWRMGAKRSTRANQETGFLSAPDSYPEQHA
jgi:hypothetical protein